MCVCVCVFMRVCPLSLSLSFFLTLTASVALSYTSSVRLIDKRIDERFCGSSLRTRPVCLDPFSVSVSVCVSVDLVQNARKSVRVVLVLGRSCGITINTNKRDTSRPTPTLVTRCSRCFWPTVQRNSTAPSELPSISPSTLFINGIRTRIPFFSDFSIESGILQLQMTGKKDTSPNSAVVDVAIRSIIYVSSSAGLLLAFLRFLLHPTQQQQQDRIISIMTTIMTSFSKLLSSLPTDKVAVNSDNKLPPTLPLSCHEHPPQLPPPAQCYKVRSGP